MLTISKTQSGRFLPPLTVDYIIETGQSNLVSRGSTAGQTDILYSYSFNLFEGAVNPNTINEVSTPLPVGPFFGVRNQLARNLLQLGRQSIFVRCAIGGTSQAMWATGQPANVNMRIAYERAQTLFRAQLAPREIIFRPHLIHMNGETNAQDAGAAAIYQAECTTFLNDLESFWGPIRVSVVGVNTGFTACPFALTVWTAQQTIGGLKPNWLFVDLNSIVGPFDGNLHYNQAQLITAGNLLTPWVIAP